MRGPAALVLPVRLRGSCRCRGFSLIEVLVAFMILAMAVTVLFRIFGGGLRNVGMTAGYAQAVAIAESELAAAGVTEPLREGEAQGQSEDRRFHWRRVVQPMDPWGSELQPVGGVALFRVDVQVQWADGGEERQIDLSTLRSTRERVAGSSVIIQ